jgi:hypothetical protein
MVGSILLVVGAVLATDAIEKYAGTTVIAPDSPFCFEVGKTSELGGDCFCVEGELTTIEELDCLVASRVVPANEYDSFRRGMGLLEPKTVELAPTPTETAPEPKDSEPTTVLVERPFCSAVGKSSELDQDCFCVEGTLDTIEELDCMVASGIVPESEYDNYRKSFDAKN